MKCIDDLLIYKSHQGGNIGLFTGCSLISFVEFIFWIWRLIYRSCVSSKSSVDVEAGGEGGEGEEEQQEENEGKQSEGVTTVLDLE